MKYLRPVGSLATLVMLVGCNQQTEAPPMPSAAPTQDLRAGVYPDWPAYEGAIPADGSADVILKVRML